MRREQFQRDPLGIVAAAELMEHADSGSQRVREIMMLRVSGDKIGQLLVGALRQFGAHRRGPGDTQGRIGSPRTLRGMN